MDEAIQEKMYKAYSLASDICDHGADLSFVSRKTYGKLWSYLDGLFEQMVMRGISGQCSLSEFLNFDLQEIEREIDSDLLEFGNILKIIDGPVPQRAA